MHAVAKVMIVEDHPLFAASICDIVSLVAPGTDYIKLDSLSDFKRVYQEYQPDLVIADLNLGDTVGAETISVLRSVDERLPLIIATADEEFLAKTRDDSANNFWRLDKNSDFQVFVESIADVMITVGLSPSWRLQSSLLSAAESGLKTVGGQMAAGDTGLSTSQQTLMELVALGLSNKEIGRKLNISPDTVKHHLTELFARFNATSRTQAATIYRRMVATRVAVEA
jgi:DNA-binding NarL/FixJ family response regulator